MQASQIPAKFLIPFANSAGSGYIRTVPQASQIGITPGAASLTDGFPPVCFQPVGAGGIPPSGQDFNGLINQITKWLQWGEGGSPVYYDATFSAAIGGYPIQSVLSAVGAPGNFWLSTVDNNTSNPDAGGANWIGFSAATSQSLVHFGVDSGSVNAYTINGLTPAISAYVDGLVVEMRVSNTSTGASTVKIGTLARIPITREDGSAVQQGDLTAGQQPFLKYDANTTSFLIAGVSSITTPARNLTSYSTAGTYTWTAPSSGWYFIRLAGGGGGGAGGGSADGTSANWSGAGGGSGGYAEGWVYIAAGVNVTVTVGAGGAGSNGSDGSIGSTGGTTSFGAYMQATGGQGGEGGSTQCPGGAPGVGSGGQTNLNGSAGTDGNPFNHAVQGGSGGASAFGGGGRTSTIGHGGVTVIDGLAPGSGGGGIWVDPVPVQTGGYGAAGIVIIEH